MSHAYHDSLDGYDARQVLHDGCLECEERGEHPDVAIAHMDTETFARAWRRAFNIHASRGDRDAEGVESYAESDLLDIIWAIQVALERAGGALNGELPLTRPALTRGQHHALVRYADGFFTGPLAHGVRGEYAQEQMRHMRDLGFIEVDDLDRGPITVTDAGRRYLREHPLRLVVPDRGER